MNELFARAARLTVLPRQAASGPVGLGPLATAQNGTVFDGFRIVFEVEKTPDSTHNPAKISLYNLSATSRANLEGEPGSLTCILEAGYAGLGGSPLVGVIFTGDIMRPVTTREGADVVTTLECGDSVTALRTTNADLAVGAGTPVAAVIAQMTGKLGLSIGTITPADAGLVFQHGASFSGLVSDHLDTLTKMAGLEWHVTDGEVNVLVPGEPTAEAPVVVSVETGLIGYPSKRVNGITDFVSLLNPLIKPGRAVLLQSTTVNETVVSRGCRYRGDTHGGDFNVTVEAY